MNAPHFKPVSDCALLVELGTVVDDEINRMVISLDRAIARAAIAGVSEVVPALVNLLIIFDPLKTDHTAIQTAVSALFPLDSTVKETGKHHALDVCYESEFSPDLEAVARACDISTEAVINAHAGAEYRVSMYGFAPGFGYLSGVPTEIQVPRKKAPIRDVATGSILIAGPQCLTTTLIMPSGWSIIGRSNAKVITGRPDKPFLFDVGDTVTFRRIGADELEQVTT